MLLWVRSSKYALPSRTAVTSIKISEVTVVPSIRAEFSSLCNTSLAQEALPVGDYKCAAESLSSFTIFLLKWLYFSGGISHCQKRADILPPSRGRKDTMHDPNKMLQAKRARKQLSHCLQICLLDEMLDLGMCEDPKNVQESKSA